MANPDKIQDMADSLNVSIYEMPDGSLHHLKGLLPVGAKLYVPKKPWPTPNHGKEQEGDKAPSGS